MLLEEKGKFMPPPVLRLPLQKVSETIQGWDNIISATHWYLYDLDRVDGADFYVGKEELGHIHLDGEIHLATNKALCAVILENKLAQKFPYADGWVQFQINNELDAQHAEWLFQLNYKRLCGVTMKELVAEIENYRMV